MTDADSTIQLDLEQATLDGFLQIPVGTNGLVIFAHGSGSSRHSSRNQAVARALREKHNLGTLLFDLLTPTEEQVDKRTRELRFDISLLCNRMISTIDWCLRDERTADLHLGLFGASTGAAAALCAAAERPERVEAVVSRGGRSDLAHQALDHVKAASLLIVGERDIQVLEVNRQAQARMQCHNKLSVIADATHLFPEPGAMEQVADQSGQWFAGYLNG